MMDSMIRDDAVISSQTIKPSVQSQTSAALGALLPCLPFLILSPLLRSTARPFGTTSVWHRQMAREPRPDENPLNENTRTRLIPKLISLSITMSAMCYVVSADQNQYVKRSIESWCLDLGSVGHSQNRNRTVLLVENGRSNTGYLHPCSAKVSDMVDLEDRE